MKSLVIVLLLAVSIYACSNKSQDKTEDDVYKYEFRKDGSLNIISQDGTIKNTFDIEIADSSEELQRGLKYRDSMEENQAMLFIMDGQNAHPFWMQDTYISLDIIYIDSAKRIFQIYSNTTPYSEQSLEPSKINAYTLEIKAGLAAKLNIEEGDLIEWAVN